MKKALFAAVSTILILSSICFAFSCVLELETDFEYLDIVSNKMEEYPYEYETFQKIYNTQVLKIVSKISFCIGALAYSIFAALNMRQIITLTSTDHAIRYTYEEYKAKMDAKKAEIKEKKLQSKKERLRKELEEMEKAE